MRVTKNLEFRATAVIRCDDESIPSEERISRARNDVLRSQGTPMQKAGTIRKTFPWESAATPGYAESTRKRNCFRPPRSLRLRPQICLRSTAAPIRCQSATEQRFSCAATFPPAGVAGCKEWGSCMKTFWADSVSIPVSAPSVNYCRTERPRFMK
jgi:hypothetical protein